MYYQGRELDRAIPEQARSRAVGFSPGPTCRRRAESSAEMTRDGHVQPPCAWFPFVETGWLLVCTVPVAVGGGKGVYYVLGYRHHWGLESWAGC